MNRLVWILPLAIVALFAGVTRLQLDANIFNLLPDGSPMVRGLQLYQRDFGSANELVILIRTADAATSSEAAETLAADLIDAGLARQAIWRNPIRGSADELGELLAYLWFNQPPDRFAAFARRFDDDRLHTTLEGTLERMAVSFQPLEVAQLGADPFDLGEIAARVKLPAPTDSADPFASADGVARIVIVAAPFDRGGFFRIRAWVGDVDAWLMQWRTDRAPAENLSIGITGNPSFVAESGSALLRDVLAAAGGTLVVVALLFWLVHRRWRPLLWLILLLTFVLCATAVIGGWVFGTLHAVALGFAAILLGLAADYGLILYQETVAHPGRPNREYRAAVAPAICWSAVTTAGAFFMIGRSSLPGLTQLGVLVGVGILIAAAVMLTAYLPLVQMRATTNDGRTIRSPDAPRVFRIGDQAALGATVLLVGATLAVLALRLPTVDSDARSLSLNSGSSRAVLEEIQRDIGGFGEDLWLVVDGAGAAEVRDALDAARPLLERAVSGNTLAGFQLPAQLWPQPDAQTANRSALDGLVERWPAARIAARDAGFADDSLRMSEAVFAAWRTFDSGTGLAWPDTPGAAWIMRQFASRSGDRYAALGRLQTNEHSEATALRELSDDLKRADAGQLVSWTLLAESLLDVMNRDIGRVLIPMTIALLVLLIVAFRGIGEVVLSMAALSVSLAALLAIMSVLGWSWNLMNVMALPMLFGAGVDYGLHVLFAMRRYRGDAVRMRNTVGRAILLCAASTAAGFATLGFASNSGIASLGRVCATGIVITSIVCVFLLPAWWPIMPRMTRANGKAPA